jgi:hypothetical protein
MPSVIDETLPIEGRPTTESVRDNFGIAKAEISVLQALATGGPFLPLIGGTLTGNLSVRGSINVLSTLLPSRLPARPFRPPAADTSAALEYGLWNDGIFLIIGTPDDRQAIASIAIEDGNNSFWVEGVLGCYAAIPSFALITTREGDPYVGLWHGGEGLHIGLTDAWGMPDRTVIKVTGAGAAFDLPVVLAGDPTLALHAATKAYVDNTVAELRAEIAALRGGPDGTV